MGVCSFLVLLREKCGSFLSSVFVLNVGSIGDVGAHSAVFALEMMWELGNLSSSGSV